MKELIIGNEIRFEDTEEAFEIKAMCDRYLICVRPYTVEESQSEKDKWNEGLNEILDELDNEEYEEESESIERDYVYENGEYPCVISEDTFAYTIVDLKDNIRGADNYYCKFDYNIKEECEKAIKELNTITHGCENGNYKEYAMKISHRNRVPLKII